MKSVSKLAAVTLLTASLAAISSNAIAADIAFSFNDGPTQFFFNRTHVPGPVTGILLGLVDNATSAPTAIKIVSSPDILGLIEGTYVAQIQDGGFTLAGGHVVAANFAFNFSDADPSHFFQMRFNCVGDLFGCNFTDKNLNLLFWNGGPLPTVGVGNQLGFSGVTYGSAAPGIPEPAAWAMMLAGFGAIGFAMRRRQKVTVSYA